MYTPQSISNTVMQLSLDDRATLFKLISENTGLFAKLMPGMPLFDQILNGNQSILHPIAEAYSTWVESNKE